MVQQEKNSLAFEKLKLCLDKRQEFNILKHIINFTYGLIFHDMIYFIVKHYLILLSNESTFLIELLLLFDDG
jgi:hypothetical protein